MISLLAAAALSAAQPTCSPPDGTAALWQEGRRFVAIGEMHGAAEAPAAFGEIACAAAGRGPVTVLLEYPVQMQSVIDAFMAEPDAGAARAILLAYPNGPFRHHDGRGSEAMMSLFQRLRTLAQQGADLRVKASVPDSPYLPAFSQSHAELDRAQLWSAIARATPDRRILIFVGSVHAEKVRRQNSRLGLPALAHFRPEETLSLFVAHQGGEAWNCTDDCGPRPIAAVDPADQRGVILRTEADGTFDGVLALGPQTASPPVARPDPSAR